MRGTFIVDDARRFVRTTDQQFDALVLAVYSSHTAIADHPVTQGRDTRRAIAPQGVLLVNMTGCTAGVALRAQPCRPGHGALAVMASAWSRAGGR